MHVYQACMQNFRIPPGKGNLIFLYKSLLEWDYVIFPIQNNPSHVQYRPIYLLLLKFYTVDLLYIIKLMDCIEMDFSHTGRILSDVYYADRMMRRRQTWITYLRSTQYRRNTHQYITKPTYNCIYNLLLYIMYTFNKDVWKISPGVWFLLVSDQVEDI